MPADRFRESHKLVGVKPDRILALVCRRNVDCRNLPAAVSKNRNQLAPAVRGHCRNDKRVFRDVKLGIYQPAYRGTAERIGVARSQLVCPVGCLEASAKHIKRTVADGIENLCRNIVAEHDNIGISGLKIISVEPSRRCFKKPVQLVQHRVFLLDSVYCFYRFIKK